MWRNRAESEHRHSVYIAVINRIAFLIRFPCKTYRDRIRPNVSSLPNRRVTHVPQDRTAFMRELAANRRAICPKSPSTADLGQVGLSTEAASKAMSHPRSKSEQRDGPGLLIQEFLEVACRNRAADHKHLESDLRLRLLRKVDAIGQVRVDGDRKPIGIVLAGAHRTLCKTAIQSDAGTAPDKSPGAKLPAPRYTGVCSQQQIVGSRIRRSRSDGRTQLEFVHQHQRANTKPFRHQTVSASRVPQTIALQIPKGCFATVPYRYTGKRFFDAFVPPR